MPSRYATLLLAAACLGLSAGLAQAQPLEPNRPVAPAIIRNIYVAEGAGKLVTLPRPMADLFAADPNVVEVRPASPDTMFVFGKGLGQTTIVATDSAGTPIAQYTVVVSPSSFARSRLQAQAQISAPGADVTAESEAGGMIVRGTVQTPEQANNVMNQARLISPSGRVVNQLQVREPIQVELKVRIATMSRTITRQLGIDWGQATTAGIMIGKFAITGNTGTSAPSISGSTPGTYGVTFPGGTFQGIIDALASDNLAHVLAEPTLTTLSGTQASFQVGGQFPVPISQTNGAVSVTYKNFGILLTFTPTVFSDGRISLQVAPQLSTLSTANGVAITSTGTTSTTIVPALTVTQASSTVILGSGQGMAIAGLLEDTSTQTDNAVPWVGEVPVLGALFRGDSFQREQQEMVITVTPYLVKPVNQPATLASPDDGWTPPNDLQRILLLRNNGTDTASTRIPGDAGFIVQ
ncbi:MAG TPA: type II and III secretion system protein family protein [Acidocella sp.]|nr:type II and III secretion system protein family protein [Acidocella sp.]